ncbi:ABC transporter substrate-binding protein [Candidatus Neomarinimicrobiota bacterium]
MQSEAGVKIGLLIPMQGDRVDEGRATQQGAELAVSEANAQGGYQGRPFELIIRSDEGLWGSGSKKIADLVFEEGIWALISGLDGRGTHLAEQIITKRQVPMVTPWATDPSLALINIPWFFRTIPDDRQQAEALTREIFQFRRLQQVAVITTGRYDDQVAANAFSLQADKEGYEQTQVLTIDLEREAIADITILLQEYSPDGLVLFTPPEMAENLIHDLRRKGLSLAIFGPMSIADGVSGTPRLTVEGTVSVVAPGYWETDQGEHFRREFEGNYGRRPPVIAAYAYDSMKIVLEAIQQAGLNRDKIRDALEGMDYPQGVTGPIRFQSNGNRQIDVEIQDLNFNKSQL